MKNLKKTFGEIKMSSFYEICKNFRTPDLAQTQLSQILEDWDCRDKACLVPTIFHVQCTVGCGYDRKSANVSSTPQGVQRR